MANFPTWISKKQQTTKSSGITDNLSPRQIANKAYSLAIKKLEKDEKRCKPHYTVRERLLLSNTIDKAQAILNKCKSRSNRRVIACEDHDDCMNLPPAKKATTLVKKQDQPLSVITPTSPSSSFSLVTHRLVVPKKEEQQAVTTNINESPCIQSEEQKLATVSTTIALVAAAAVYNSALQKQKNESTNMTVNTTNKPFEFCRPMVPTVCSTTSHHSITTII